VVVLVYITLDLSLASMPGAFVFDASDSVESVQTSRTPSVPIPAAAVAPARDPRALVSIREVRARPQFFPMPSIHLMPLRTSDGTATPSLDPAPPSEDPH
jgi:hypothetical protein